jgi:ferredoxin
MLADSAIEDVLAAADRKTDRIAQVISDGRSIKERDSNIYAMITRAHAYKDQWESDFLGFDSGFTSSDSCNACGNCEKFCPFGNITVSQRPRWNGHCEACLRCINICPKHAIQYGALTEGRRRYFNPRVSIRDLG